MDTSTWSERELASADLGDQRLTDRFKIILEDLVERPSGPISRSCNSKKKKKAAYRFFSNCSVIEKDIMAPHYCRTAERAAGLDVILNVQDTTYLNFSDHKTAEGLGRIGDKKRLASGLIMHSGYAFSVDGMPLGLTSHKIAARKSSKFDRGSVERKKQIRKMSDAERESYRWIEALDDAQASLPDGAHIIHVCDREADFYDFMKGCAERNTSFLLRAKNERMVLVEGDEGEESALSDVIASSPVCATTTVTLLGNGDRDTRCVQLELHHKRVTLLPPSKREQMVSIRSPREHLPLEVNAIWAVEKNNSVQDNSKMQRKISWLILTLDEVTTPSQVIEKVEQYSKRWLIEIFHKLIKTGFRIEQCCLNTKDRLSKYIKTVCIAAFRLFELTYLNRSEPKAPCTKVLTSAEYQALILLKTGKKEQKQKTVTIREAVHWIAEIGGYWGRKGDCEPGIITIWRGWQTIIPVANAMEALCTN